MKWMIEKKEMFHMRHCIFYLSHIDDSHSQSLVTEDGSILVAFPPLQHNLQSVGIPLQKMWVLEVTHK